jgi:hypothetical protein
MGCTTKQTWSPLGNGENNGVDHKVFAMAVQGNDLYVGGAFRTAGGIPVNYIAKYNAVTNIWTSLGDGVSNYGHVNAIAVKNGEVYIGGQFSSAGGVPANNIAKWNGREWSALGSGVNADVHALTICGDDLYVGGIFTNAGGSDASYIAKWNTINKTWSTVGGGVQYPVFALASDGRVVYVGGAFNYAGEIEAGKIAKWNPAKSCWSRVGSFGRGDYSSGVNGTVYSLLARGKDIYIGGKFNKAGGKPSQLFAIWHEPASPSPHTPAWSSVPNVTFQEEDSTQLELYQFATDVDHDLRGLNFGAKVIKF